MLTLLTTSTASRLHAVGLQGRQSSVAHLLQNVHSYYSQYLPHVKKSLAAGLELVEKHLKASAATRAPPTQQLPMFLLCPCYAL